MIHVSLDGGKTWVEAKDGVRVIVDDLPLSNPAMVYDSETGGQLVFNFTSEGLITDVWADEVVVDDPLQKADKNLGTESAMYDDIIERLIEGNQ